MAVVVRTVGKSASTFALSLARQWLRERIDDNLEQYLIETNTSQIENNTSLNEHEEFVARCKCISEKLTKQLDEITSGINILRNKNYECAQSWFLEALRWRHNESKFKEYIKLSFHRCVEAKSTITDSPNKIHLYSLLIASGFIHHSKYGEHLIEGLQHVHNVLVDMNNDVKIKKDLSSALAVKIYWTKKK
eukprot:83338_1